MNFLDLTGLTHYHSLVLGLFEPISRHDFTRTHEYALNGINGTIYFTTDTNKIILNGKVFGGSSLPSGTADQLIQGDLSLINKSDLFGDYYTKSEIDQLTLSFVKLVDYENDTMVISASLNDLNRRLTDLEDDTIDLSEYATVSQLSQYLPLTGGTMSGDITMSGETKLVFGDTSVYNNGHLFIDGALQVESQVTANGFSHALHTSDDYVLLAGGGAKLLSEISSDMSGYLPLTGGTMSGDTKFNGASIYFDEDCAALRMNDAGALEIYSEDGITLSGFVECSGSITCASSINAQAFYETSDARKKDIKEDLSLDKCYDLIEKCQTVIYSLKDQTKEQVGMIAQEIEEFFPEVVATDEEGFKSLAYDRLVVICFKVLKDVIKRLEKLENNGSN